MPGAEGKVPSKKPKLLNSSDALGVRPGSKWSVTSLVKTGITKLWENYVI